MEIKDAACVITGAAGGLGTAFARDLRARGARIVISDIDTLGIQELGDEVGAGVVHCDVTDQESVVALGRAAIDAMGRIDIWINNAGIWTPYVPVGSMDLNRARRLIDVNYFGVAHGTMTAIDHMKPRGSGAVVNILSVRALKGKALAAAYSASKFAAEGFTQAVREELQGSGLSIIGVYPHRIKTGLFGENRHEDYESSMEPSDVAKIIVDNIANVAPREHVEIWSPTDVRFA